MGFLVQVVESTLPESLSRVGSTRPICWPQILHHSPNPPIPNFSQADKSVVGKVGKVGKLGKFFLPHLPQLPYPPHPPHLLCLLVRNPGYALAMY